MIEQDHQPERKPRSAPPKKNKVRSSQTLLRGLDIIDAIANGIEDLSAIAKATGITYSTTHRILSALQQRHYVRREPSQGYRLGSALLTLGYQAQAQIDLVTLARPLLTALAHQTLDTVHLGIRSQDSIVYLEKLPSRRPVEISSRVGGNKPLFSTGIGKALLLDQGEQQWLQLYDRSPAHLQAICEREKWLQMMHHYAQNGYAFDLGEDEPSIRCVAAPIRDGRNQIVAATSISSTTDYMPPARMLQLAEVVQQTALQISMALGYRSKKLVFCNKNSVAANDRGK